MEKLTTQEEAAMRLIWEIGPCVVRTLQEQYPEPKPPYTTLASIVKNLERKKYELDYDANELYKTSILRQYPFEVWKNEKFVPEAVSLNRIALRGYKLRWYNKVLVVSDYLNDGMTKQSWSLLKNNPMGYAIAFNESLLYPDLSFKGRIYAVIQFIVLVLISGNWLYLFKSKKPLLTVLLIPLGGIWSIRRYFQLKKL